MQLSDIISKEFIAKLDSLSININKNINSLYGGIRKSNIKGNSLEFADYKNYTMGDDIKNVDWNSYARTDKLFVKLFREEKQATINIFIDNSKSMDYGEKNKLLYAKVIASAISYIALSNQDKVNIFAYNNNAYSEKINVSSKNMFYNIVNFLDNIYANGTITFSDIILDSLKKNLGNGTSIFISDFLFEDNYKNSVSKLLYKKQEVIFIQLLSEEEIHPKFRGAIEFIENESEQTQKLFIDDNIIMEYNKELNSLRSKLEQFCKQSKLKYNFISTDINYMKALSQIL